MLDNNNLVDLYIEHEVEDVEELPLLIENGNIEDDNGNAGGGKHKQVGADVNEQLGAEVNEELGGEVNEEVGGEVNEELGGEVNEELGGLGLEELRGQGHEELVVDNRGIGGDGDHEIGGGDGVEIEQNVEFHDVQIEDNDVGVGMDNVEVEVNEINIDVGNMYLDDDEGLAKGLDERLDEELDESGLGPDQPLVFDQNHVDDGVGFAFDDGIDYHVDKLLTTESTAPVFGSAEASASVVFPSLESIVGAPSSVNASSTVGEALHLAAAERPITFASLQREAQMKFKQRMENLKIQEEVMPPQTHLRAKQT
ncbi:hypothetical protein COLO4_20122 [Corchorus olitorius]|uniref:Uncharacterized protein n=1 Tax=Corchorus olitorius TaxID=93759 RepID=A0A1R3J1J7_9ROSI|nr:hypothetical protein COLO4_20122 [Corchorus olitorius]